MFEAIGLNKQVVDCYFTGTASRVEGVGLEVLAREAKMKHDLAWAPVLLYIAGIFWTLFYDTIYAHQDKEDDALIGVKSTARYFGDRTRAWLTGFAVATILLLMAMVTAADLGWAAKLGVIGVALHLGWQAAFCNFDDPKDCLAKFRSNRFIGWILLAGLIIAKLTQ